jgi:phage terminase large subunit-like protein
VIEDDAFFGFVAAADPEDDWTQPATWTKANPNLGVSVKLDYLARQAKKAESQPSFLNTFLRLHLGQWTQQRERWIAIEDWNACEARDLTPAEMREREEALAGAVCYGGLDLSTKLDITAALLVFPRDDEVLELVCRFWVPEERIRERVRRDRVPYDAWVRDGWLLATPGNVIDYDVIRAEVGRLAARFDVRELGYDPWNATQLALQLQGDGITVVEIRQGYKTLSEPSKEWEARTVARRIRHGGHPVLRWMVSNVAAREDPAGNIKPDKAASGERIDGVVAGIMGLSRIIVQHDPGSVYDERGVLSFG